MLASQGGQSESTCGRMVVSGQADNDIHAIRNMYSIGASW